MKQLITDLMYQLLIDLLLKFAYQVIFWLQTMPWQTLYG